eukprot:CAMPEP_0170558350 /NCGR_PEP_ID=MMETSP0211-20121228/34675_1 /TAXON_ID=311385 /ORGANISM="Pseudokeronopsis sp., Strain OXSARD2" /LENGTH=123 /DNA_ID=CAMNT_0010870201 /DNA_START=1031 /DNA_END=1399 /DNA_ORIENTATION=+
MNSLGAKIRVFTSEIGGGMSLGIGNFFKDIVILLLVLFTQPMFDSALQPQGVFFLFGTITILGGVHHYFMVRETDGLTYEQKQQLYAPKEAKELPYLTEQALTERKLGIIKETEMVHIEIESE